MSYKLGIISDTHSILRPEVENALAGCEMILHAGDVGNADVLQRLQCIAPVVAVRGNMDYGSWSNALQVTEMVEIHNVFFYILHDLFQLDLEPVSAGIHVVVHGHTHRSEIIRKDGVIYLNPGSAAHGRYNSPVSLALVCIENGDVKPRIVEFDL